MMIDEVEVLSQFLSWINSQSGASLVVGTMTFGGVVGTTVLNNKKADERRRADQASEDARRRREREIQTSTDEVARQRREVGECVGQIRRAAETDYQTTREALTTYIGRIAKRDPIAILEFNALLLHSRGEFYLSSMDAAERLALELTHPEVRRKTLELRRILQEEAEEFRLSSAQDVRADVISNSPQHSPRINRAIDDLVETAFEHLHLNREPSLVDSATGVQRNQKKQRKWRRRG